PVVSVERLTQGKAEVAKWYCAIRARAQRTRLVFPRRAETSSLGSERLRPHLALGSRGPLRVEHIHERRKCQPAVANQVDIDRLHSLIVRGPAVHQQLTQGKRDDLCVRTWRESGRSVASGAGLQRAPQIDHVHREYHVRFTQQRLTPLGRLER